MTTPTSTGDRKNVSGANLKRPRATVENKAFDAFARRIIRAYAKRVASGDIEALAQLVELQEGVVSAIADAIVGLRDFGYSWTDVAARLGVARPPAFERWTVKKPKRETTTPNPLAQDTLFDAMEHINDWN
jgi:hypothetical protein